MSNMQGYKNINEYSNSCIQSKLYFLKWEKRIKRHQGGKNKTEMQKKWKEENKKNSKTDRGKLPDRTQIEATFSSHNLEEWSSPAFTDTYYMSYMNLEN